MQKTPMLDKSDESVVRAFLSAIGRKGGASRSPRKLAAVKENLRRANERKRELRHQRGSQLRDGVY